jgi:hypothetical protein
MSRPLDLNRPLLHLYSFKNKVRAVQSSPEADDGWRATALVYFCRLPFQSAGVIAALEQTALCNRLSDTACDDR